MDEKKLTAPIKSPEAGGSMKSPPPSDTTGPPDETITTHHPAPSTSPSRRRLVRTLDRRLMPILFLSYLFFFLDKSNIAFAYIHGLARDLRFVEDQFNIALVVFFVPNLLLAIPGNLLLRRVGGARWLSQLMVAWGLVTFCTAFVKDARGLYITRVFLGAAESSFLGGTLIYLGFFYDQAELVLRVGLLYAASPLAGFLGGLLAGGLSLIDLPFPTSQFQRWPWIFLVEGAATIVLGLLALWLLPNTPAELSGTEQTPHPAEDARDKSTLTDDRLSWKLCKRGILNTMTMLMAAGAFFSIISIYSYALFLPTIIREMGYRAVVASLMTAPPNFVGFVGTVLLCEASRRYRRTGVFLIFCAAVAAVGFALLLTGGRLPGRLVLVVLQYAGTFLVSLGVHPLAPLALTWLHVNTSPHYVRAVALGFVVTVGNFGPFVASFTYIPREAPQYTRGHAINVASLVCLAAVSFVFRAWARRENARRDAGRRDYRLGQERWQGRPREEYEMELGWLHPQFRLRI